MNERTYITLLEPGDNDSVGAVIDNDPIAVTEPRMLPFDDLLLGQHALMADFVDGLSPRKLVTVEPLTTPVECDNGTAYWYEAAAWRVTGPAPWAPVFGPQGAEIIDALALITPMLQGTFCAEPPAKRYYDLLFKTERQAEEALQAALDALDRAGADRWWWAEGAWQCGLYGPELVAMAARDLLGNVHGWTVTAYNTLTAPYRAAFGEDAPGAAPLPVGFMPYEQKADSE